MFRPNSLFYTDGYKIGHKKMLAPGTTKLYGTWIPRSTKHAPKGITSIVSFGQQLAVRWLHDEWAENFFALPKSEVAKFAKDMSSYLGLEFDAAHFEALHDLGYLPIKIKSLPEGIETGTNVPHMTFINTVDGFGWLTLYLETIISSLAWKPATSATIALQYRRNLEEWVQKTDPANAWLIDFLAHDFSARGLSPWDMLSSGLGHATSFRGSDTLVVIPAARYFYNEPEDEVCINSVNASEHSVSTTKIFTVGESQMIADWLGIFQTGILSIVSDTFDLWKLITEYLPEHKEAIMNREGKVVIRPDSGNPVDILCGTVTDFHNSLKEAKEKFDGELCSSTVHGEREFTIPESRIIKIEDRYYELKASVEWNRYDKQYYYIEQVEIESQEISTKPEFKGVIELLWEVFGGTLSKNNYKVLDSHIGAIYGDSITLERQIEIYERLEAKGFAATNIVLGVGSFTYQFNTRDTLGFAAKGAWFESDGETYDIYKDPITDDGTKKSLKGLIMVDENYEVHTQCTLEQEATGMLRTIYEDGRFYNQTSLTEIREKLKSSI